MKWPVGPVQGAAVRVWRAGGDRGTLCGLMLSALREKRICDIVKPF